MNGTWNILDVLGAEIAEYDRELIGDLFVHRSGNADAARSGQPL
jgi:hypothetical protein